MRPKFFCSRGLQRNVMRASLAAFKEVQLDQLDTFRRHAVAGEWSAIHHDHYDWYMFPVEDGSQPQYNVHVGDVAELSSDEEWSARYRESLTLVAAAWGWDLAGKVPISEPAPGQSWTDWDVRLAKMIRSTWLFGAHEEMVSLQRYAAFVKPRGGLSYGHINLDEVFFMR